MSTFVRQFHYDKFKGMDVFFTSGGRPHNYVVRFACAAGSGLRAAFRAARSRQYADHAGFITTQHGQVYATQQTPRGMREGSLDDFRGTRCAIIAVKRWTGWNVDGMREWGEQEMARKRRYMHEVRYDLWGAITSSWLGRKLFPNARADDRRTFCSEDCIDTIIRAWPRAFGGTVSIPLPKSKSPQAVLEWMDEYPQWFEDITDFEFPQKSRG